SKFRREPLTWGFASCLTAIPPGLSHKTLQFVRHVASPVASRRSKRCGGGRRFPFRLTARRLPSRRRRVTAASPAKPATAQNMAQRVKVSPDLIGGEVHRSG